MNGFEYSATIYSIFFGIGMLFQSCLLLTGRWESGDMKKIIIIPILAFGVMLAGIIEPDYKLSELVVASLLLSAIAFVHLFKKQLLLQISDPIILLWNLLFVSLVILSGNLSLPLLILIGIPFLFTLAGCFSSINKLFVWQVFSYTWMSIILVLIGLYQFNVLAFGSLFGETSTQISLFEVFISGASFLYLLINVWFVFALIPITRKRQTFTQRIREIRNHMQLMASGYTEKKYRVFLNVLIVTLLPILFYINHTYDVFTANALIGMVLVLASILGRHKYS